jgi:hypothetical protein
MDEVTHSSHIERRSLPRIVVSVEQLLYCLRVGLQLHYRGAEFRAGAREQLR